jgi:methionine-rich copper-binding protein CopC
MIQLRRRLVAASFSTFILALTAPVTLGHAALETSDPPAGGTIASPYVLVFRFDEALTSAGSSVVVRDAAGTIVAEGGLSQDDAFTQVVELPAVRPGAYEAHWISITADDNGKTQGDVSFTVVAATPPPSVTPQPSTSPTYQPPPSSTPPATSVPTTPTTATPAPTPAPGASQSSGSELIVPLVLVGAVAVGLGWFLLRRRPS